VQSVGHGSEVWILIRVIVVMEESRVWGVSLVAEGQVLSGAKWEMWLGVERECWIGVLYVRRGNGNRFLRRGCLRPAGLLLLTSPLLGLHLRPTAHDQCMLSIGE
jgi:hypothetical protein